MARRWAVILTCLLATSVRGSDLNSGYDPGSHGPNNADSEDDGYGARNPTFGPAHQNFGNNEWTPVAGPGPSGNDVVYQNKNGAKTLVAGSPTSPIAESINYYGPPPSPPVVQHTHQLGYRYPPPPPPRPQQVPVSYGVETNHIHAHHESPKNIPTNTIINTIRVPVPQPYKVLIDKKVPYEVKVPVHVPVPRPVQVAVPRPVKIPVDKPYEVIVERKVPYEVRVPVQVPIQVPYPVDVPQPYPVHVPVPKPIIIKHPVPVVIKIIKSGERKGLFG